MPFPRLVMSISSSLRRPAPYSGFKSIAGGVRLEPGRGYKPCASPDSALSNYPQVLLHYEPIEKSGKEGPGADGTWTDDGGVDVDEQ